jgi:hypothetical protein
MLKTFQFTEELLPPYGPTMRATLTESSCKLQKAV